MSPLLRALVGTLACLGLMLVNGVVLIYMLRKVLAHFHLRVGPMRVGWHGVLQTLADVVKLLTKEDLNPSRVDKALFVIAPFAVFVPSLLAYTAIPYSETLVAAPLDAGAFFTFAVLAMVPVGVLMSGWASNSKWSLVGGMRATAQQIAYEVPLLLSALGVVLMAGSLDLTEIVLAQKGYWLGFVPRFYIIPQLPAFVLFLVAALAELNQTPFDMSEAESELVAGFVNEYSGMKFAFFFLAEFSNSFIISALAVALFFGGWLVPGFESNGLMLSLAPVVFLVKTYIGIFVLMWIRGTLPRIRIDQLLSFSWKGLIPFGLAWLLLTGLLVKVAESRIVADLLARG